MSDVAAACKPARPGAAHAARWRGWLDPGTPDGGALRTTLAAALAAALAFALHVELPALAVVFVLARGSAGVVAMLAGALAGTAAALLLLQLFDQHAVAFSLALFVLSAVATYGALGRRWPYLWIQLLLSLLVLVGQALETPQAAVPHAFYGLAAVAIAALASFVAGASQPVAIPAQLQETLAATLRTCAALLDQAGGRTGATVLRLELLSRRQHALLAVAWPTRLVSRRRHAALAAAVRASGELTRHVLAIDGTLRAASTAPALAERSRIAALRDAACDVAATLAAPRGPVDDDRTVALHAARASAAALRAAPAPPDDDVRMVASLDGGARRALARLAALAPQLLPGGGPIPLAASDGEADPPWLPLDRFRLRHAVKSAGAFLLVLWCWVASHWGAIVPALVVAVLVATLATPLGATLTKAALRVGGALAGGVAGLLVAILVLPYVTSLPAICLVLALALFGFLWLQQRDERLAFASLQAAIAFALTLVQGSAPSATWRAPLESVIGLAFGISVVVFVMHALWPLDATTSAHRVLAELLADTGRRFAAILEGGAATARRRDDRRAAARARATRAHAAGFAHEVELYGTQFGRPREHLRELLRLTFELDAALSLLAAAVLASRRPTLDAPAAGAAQRAALGAALARATDVLAADMTSPPGAPPPPDLRATLAELERGSEALAAGAPPAAVGVRVARTVLVATRLLGALAEKLASPAHRAPRRRARAA